LSGTAVKLSWQVHGGNPQRIVIERREDPITGHGYWQRIAELPPSATEYTDSALKKAQQASYRVRASNSDGISASSNIARIPVAP
jgi:hypothetical protein